MNNAELPVSTNTPIPTEEVKRGLLPSTRRAFFASYSISEHPTHSIARYHLPGHPSSEHTPSAKTAPGISSSTQAPCHRLPAQYASHYHRQRNYYRPSPQTPYYAPDPTRTF